MVDPALWDRYGATAIRVVSDRLWCDPVGANAQVPVRPFERRHYMRRGGELWRVRSRFQGWTA